MRAQILLLPLESLSLTPYFSKVGRLRSGFVEPFQRFASLSQSDDVSRVVNR